LASSDPFGAPKAQRGAAAAQSAPEIVANAWRRLSKLFPDDGPARIVVVPPRPNNRGNP